MTPESYIRNIKSHYNLGDGAFHTISAIPDDNTTVFEIEFYVHLLHADTFRTIAQIMDDGKKIHAKSVAYYKTHALHGERLCIALKVYNTTVELAHE